MLHHINWDVWVQSHQKIAVYNFWLWDNCTGHVTASIEGYLVTLEVLEYKLWVMGTQTLTWLTINMYIYIFVLLNPQATTNAALNYELRFMITIITHKSSSLVSDSLFFWGTGTGNTLRSEQTPHRGPHTPPGLRDRQWLSRVWSAVSLFLWALWYQRPPYWDLNYNKQRACAHYYSMMMVNLMV